MLNRLFSNLFYVLKPAGLIAIRGLLSDLHRGFVLSGFGPITRLPSCKKAAQLNNLHENTKKLQDLLKGMGYEHKQ